jgi:DNA-directed RNA polymerase subunit RPC12/RpoP
MHLCREKKQAMIPTTEIQCPHCQSNDLVKQGKTGNGTQNGNAAAKKNISGCITATKVR